MLELWGLGRVELCPERDQRVCVLNIVTQACAVLFRLHEWSLPRGTSLLDAGMMLMHMHLLIWTLSSVVLRQSMQRGFHSRLLATRTTRCGLCADFVAVM